MKTKQYAKCFLGSFFVFCGLSLYGIHHEEMNASPGSANEQIESGLQESIVAFLAADTPEKAGKACLQIFPDPYSGTIRLLATHEDRNMAIQAAWRGYSRMIPTRPIEFGGKQPSIDPRDLQRFLGFLEGRACVVVPEWWENALADNQSYIPPSSFAHGGWSKCNNIVAKRDQSHVYLMVADEHVRIPKGTFDDLADVNDEIAVHIHEKFVILLMKTTRGFSTKIACIDRENATELWQNSIWGLGSPQATSGNPASTFVSMEIVDGRVFVFATAVRIGSYVESFEAKNGTPWIRFCTTNWFVSGVDH